MHEQDGIPELITHEDNGILILPENSEKLIEAISKLLSEKEFAKKLTENGYDFVMKNLTWEVLLPKYIKFYEYLLDET